MLMFIIGMSLLFSYVMSYLHISQSFASGSSGSRLSKWVLLPRSCVGDRARLLPAAGEHHPDDLADLPAAAEGRGLRPGVVRRRDDHRHGDRTDPPAGGLNIFVIKNIAPDIPLADIIRGMIPFVVLMLLAIILICVFPSIATLLPQLVMGTGR